MNAQHVIETKRRLTDYGIVWIGISGMSFVWIAGAAWALLS